jgi:hypothetical protein
VTVIILRNRGWVIVSCTILTGDGELCDIM